MPLLEMQDALQSPDGFLQGVEHDDAAKTRCGFDWVLYQASPGTVLTGSVAETMLLSVNVPRRILGLNGELRLRAHVSWTISANNKILAARLGGQDMGGATSAAGQGGRFEWVIYAVNSHTAQGTDQTSGTQFTGGFAARNVDLNADTQVRLFGQLTLPGEQLKLEHVTIFVSASYP